MLDFFKFVARYIASVGKVKSKAVTDKTKSLVLENGTLRINYANPKVEKDIADQMVKYSKLNLNTDR